MLVKGLQDNTILFDPLLLVCKNRQNIELYKTSYEARLKQLDYDLKFDALVKIKDVFRRISSQLNAIRMRFLAMSV